MNWIKLLLNITLLFTLSFVGRKTIKPKEEPKYGTWLVFSDRLKIDFIS